MRYYPAFLDLYGKRCLLVGAGDVGQRKLGTLLSCSPAEVLVLDQYLKQPLPYTLAALIDHPAASFESREFQASDLEGRFLVVAATADPTRNGIIGRLCRERGILCNVVDDPEAGSFIVPAHLCLGELTVALSSSGSSPALTRKIRSDLQTFLGQRYEGFLTLMGRLRPLVLNMGHKSEWNRSIFHALVESPLSEALHQRDGSTARRLLQEILPPDLHPSIDEVLHGLA